MNPVGFKFEGGKLIVTVAAGLDSDKDGVKAVDAKIDIAIDAAEAINEIFKKDVAWLNTILGALNGVKG